MKVTEDPNRVEVAFRGRTHAGSWTGEDADTGDSADVDEDPGSDHLLLISALLCWDGEEEFDVTTDDLVDQGYWTPSEG